MRPLARCSRGIFSLPQPMQCPQVRMRKMQCCLVRSEIPLYWANTPLMMLIQHLLLGTACSA